MIHEERIQLARDLCVHMVARYSGDVILGGVYGSTARGTDTHWSDLEMLLVVHDGSEAVLEVLFEMNQALCLLNQRWVAHDYYQGLCDAFSFPKLPEGYQALVPALWSARDIDEIVPLAETLVGNYWRLLADEGIKLVDYQTVDQLPL